MHLQYKSDILALEHVMLVTHTIPADWGWGPTSAGGFGVIMSVWLSPFSAGSVTLWSTFDSDGASLPASTCPSHSVEHICNITALSTDSSAEEFCVELFKNITIHLSL